MGATNAGEPEGVFHGWELPYRLQAQSFIEGPAIKMSRVLSATKCYKHIWRINSSKKHTCFAVPRRIAVRRRVQLQADPCTYALLYIAHQTNGSH